MFATEEKIVEGASEKKGNFSVHQCINNDLMVISSRRNQNSWTRNQ